MKEKIMKILMDCDRFKEGILSHPDMAPSSNIKTIAEYLTKQLLNMGVLK